MANEVKHGVSLFSDYDIHLFKEGKHFKLWKKLGAHTIVHEKEDGVLFAVWAPNAATVAVMGEFNGWNRSSHQLAVRW
ncbi:MAG TPA: 1,4-alpha-glucan branching enzyme, partial [Bacteroidetes bacterium]|nr:1,4-alpha-glucan branching enzyme [Bacteroidota bacterium]